MASTSLLRSALLSSGDDDALLESKLPRLTTSTSLSPSILPRTSSCSLTPLRLFNPASDLNAAPSPAPILPVDDLSFAGRPSSGLSEPVCDEAEACE